MAMPSELVLVRHGRSEANEIQAMFKRDALAVPPEGFFDQHDSAMRLAPIGREVQAPAAGEWLKQEFPEGFDRYFTSPLIRTVETAGRLALGVEWEQDDRWRERDWGEYGIINETERLEKYQLSQKLKKQNAWYWCPPGGESNATGVRLRFEDILDTSHRELEGKKVIAVTHGDFIDVARFVLERMTPMEWLVHRKDQSQKIDNCQILHYSRHDPENGELAGQLRWFRSICPWDESKSWNGGEWITIPPRRKYSDQELLDLVEAFPTLLTPIEEPITSIG